MNNFRIKLFFVYVDEHNPIFRPSAIHNHYNYCGNTSCDDCTNSTKCGCLGILDVQELDYLKLNYPEYFL